MHHWVDKMFYVLNFLTTILFVLIALYPCILWAYSELETPFKWNHYCIHIVWYAYSAFCIFKLTKYLRQPNPKHDLNFLLYLLGLIPAFCIVFLLAVIDFDFPTVGN